MRALGKRGLPPTIAVNGRTYYLTREVTHDFWAATGFYDSDAGERVVLKAGRAEDFAGFPLDWIGRWLRDREVRMYDKLRDVPNIPCVLGSIGTTGFVLEYVRARPLQKGDDVPVPDGFFARLRSLTEEIHRRGIAYVDMNKRANILVGEDGFPHLVDFQISLDLHGVMNTALGRRILRRLQREDLYHVTKHHARLRPDELTDEQRASSERRSVLIRLHRLVMKPWFSLRRRTWKRLRDTGRLLPEGSE